MLTSFSLQNILRRKLALAVVTGTACVAAGAQTVTTATTEPAVNFQLPAAAAGDATQGVGTLFSDSSNSSSVDAQDAGATATQLNLASLENGIKLPGLDAQYGRRRYGAPRYRGGNTNADGSAKYTFFGGVGLTVPEGSNSNYLKTSYAFQVGAGRNFNKHLGLNLQFDWDNFGVTGQTIGNYASLVFGDTTNATGVDAHSHIWSFTLNPTYQIYSGEGLGAYLVVGGGFYHKEMTFTVPEEGEGYDIYYGPYLYEANVPVQNYTSNSAGVNGGIGITYKFSHFSNERLYAEARVVHTFNSYRPESTIYNDGTVSGWNFFPQNSLSTTYTPIKVGIRF